MENAPLKFNQKFLEFQKSALDKVNAVFSPKIENASQKKTAAQFRFSIAIQKAQAEHRELSPEEKELEKIAKKAEHEFELLQTQWQEEKTKAEVYAKELTFEFFTKNTTTILELLKHDIPLQIAILALAVMNLSFDHEYKQFIENGNHKPQKSPLEAEINLFNDEMLRTRLHSIFKRFLDVLKDNDAEGLKKAYELIEKGIKNKKRILSNIRKQLITVFEDVPQEENARQEDIIKTTTRKAKDFTSGTTKLESKVFSPKDNPAFYGIATEAQIWVGNNRKNELLTIASIDFNEMKKKGVSIPTEKWLTPFDREILSAASSLYEAGNEYITPKMIFQALSGNKKDLDITPAIRNEIIHSIDKLMSTTIEINASAEAQAGWRQEAEYKGPLLPCERVTKKNIRVNGQEVADCIHLFRNSPLYDYAKGINQISRVNIGMLNAPVNNTQENITLKGYLLRQITSMKSPHSKIKPVIRYDTIFEYLGIENSDTKTKKRVRDRTKEILNFWVNEGLITGFKEEKEGKTFARINIKL